MTRLRGHPIDGQSRCIHWGGPTDVVAFRFACCDGWWPCHACHEDTADHAAVPWPVHGPAGAQTSVLCGVCGHAMTGAGYMQCESRCPACQAKFNPACKAHWPLYFFGIGGTK